MNAKLAVVLTVFVVAGAIYFGTPWKQTPVAPTMARVDSDVVQKLNDRLASQQTKDVFRRLQHYSNSPKFLSGQNVGHMSEDLPRSHYRTWVRLVKFRKQPAPAIMEFDLGLDDLTQTTVNLRRLAADHARAGGIVSISMHPSNPWTGGAYNELKPGSFDDLFKSGTEANRRWLGTLDRAAEVLKELQDQNIPVLWRPLHEANGDWFWWSAGGDTPMLQAGQYKQLWAFMFDRFQKKHQLHDLIWVFAANTKTGPEVIAWKDVYPGDNVVDLVGIDYYGADLLQIETSGTFQDAVKTGKMIALSEFGKKPMDGSLNGKKFIKNLKRFPQVTYFSFWHSWPDHLAALADMDDVETILNNDVVENLDDLRLRFGDATKPAAVASE